MRKPRKGEKVMFMHTVNGQAAYFDPAERSIYLATRSRFARGGIELASSVEQVRVEQAASREKDAAAGEAFDYGYVRVIVPSADA